MNWFKRLKFAAYGVATTYGFWIDMTGELLAVEPQQHSQSMRQADWLSEGWEEEYESVYEAAFGHGIIRAVVSPVFSISPTADPDAKLLSFENLSMMKITSQQRQVMIGMFMELKKSNRNSECSLEFNGFSYKVYTRVGELDIALNQLTAEVEDPSISVNL